MTKSKTASVTRRAGFYAPLIERDRRRAHEPFKAPVVEGAVSPQVRIVPAANIRHSAAFTGSARPFSPAECLRRRPAAWR
jgi:hypothetical protein